MNNTFLVPVRTTSAGTLALRTGRLLNGERVGLAFTSEASLLLALGPSQAWVPLSPPALRVMLAPLGIRHFRIDPHPAGELMTRRGESLPMARPPVPPERNPRQVGMETEVGIVGSGANSFVS